MKIILYVFSLSLFLGVAEARSTSVETVFKSNKIHLEKTEIVNGRKTYYVKLPFDPSVGMNSHKLEAKIAAVNDCKPFVLVSDVDKVKILVNSKLDKGHCLISEEIHPFSEVDH